MQYRADCVGTVTVNVDQGVEGAFGAAKEPVDGPLFVELDVVVVEVFEEVVTDSLAFFGSEIIGI